MRTMGRFVAYVTTIVAASLLVAAGGWLTYFGLGAGGGSTSRSWATFGPLLAGFGVALVIVAVGKRKTKTGDMSK